VPEEYEAGVLKVVRVSEVMRKDVHPIPPEMTVGDLVERMGRGEPSFNLTQGLPIIGKDGQLVGVVTQGDLLRALEADPTGKATVLDVGARNLVVAYADESAFDALFRMLQNDIGRLPVVSRENPKEMIGYLNRSSILGAWTRQMEEEGLREHGWVKQWRGAQKTERN
jgi:CBS domain-containing protein